MPTVLIGLGGRKEMNDQTEDLKGNQDRAQELAEKITAIIPPGGSMRSVGMIAATIRQHESELRTKLRKETDLAVAAVCWANAKACEGHQFYREDIRALAYNQGCRDCAGIIRSSTPNHAEAIAEIERKGFDDALQQVAKWCEEASKPTQTYEATAFVYRTVAAVCRGERAKKFLSNKTLEALQPKKER